MIEVHRRSTKPGWVTADFFQGLLNKKFLSECLLHKTFIIKGQKHGIFLSVIGFVDNSETNFCL